MLKIALFGTFIATTALCAGISSSYADSAQPRLRAGCARVGDVKYEDVWDFCPSGQFHCQRWAGYFGFGAWKSCNQVGLPPVRPCTWSAGTHAWLCDGGITISCNGDECR